MNQPTIDKVSHRVSNRVSVAVLMSPFVTERDECLSSKNLVDPRGFEPLTF